MTEQIQKATAEIAHRHDLHYKTVEDLLSRGWVYTENLNGEIKWERKL